LISNANIQVAFKTAVYKQVAAHPFALIVQIRKKPVAYTTGKTMRLGNALA
jgi:hypothetical protein